MLCHALPCFVNVVIAAYTDVIVLHTELVTLHSNDLDGSVDLSYHLFKANISVSRTHRNLRNSLVWSTNKQSYWFSMIIITFNIEKCFNIKLHVTWSRVILRLSHNAASPNAILFSQIKSCVP